TSYVRRPVIGIGWVWGRWTSVELLSLGTPGGRTSSGSRSACAPRMARERRSPLDGENPDELDAAADRHRGARYERTYGYGVAEHHRRRRVPVARPSCQHPTDQASRRGSSADLDPPICRRPAESLPSMIDGTGNDDLCEADRRQD